MHRRHTRWLVGWLGLCAGLLLLDGAGHVRDAEGCSGGPPGSTGGGGEEPPAPTACEVFQLDQLELPYSVVPASPGAIPLDVRARCATAGQGPGVLSAPVTITVRPAGGGDAIAGATTGNAPVTITSSRDLALGWSPSAPLAAGTYEVSARLEGDQVTAATATFEVQVPYAPELKPSLGARVDSSEDPTSEEFCCQDCGKRSCVRTRRLNQGTFRVTWPATPWTAATVSWDGAAAESFAGPADDTDTLTAASSGQHCARVVFSDLTTGAPLGEQTLCASLCFDPSVPTSCQQATGALQWCGPFVADRSEFLERICAVEPVTPTCDDAPGGPPAGPGVDEARSSAGCSLGARAGGGGGLLTLATLATARRRRRPGSALAGAGQAGGEPAGS